MDDMTSRELEHAAGAASVPDVVVSPLLVPLCFVLLVVSFVLLSQTGGTTFTGAMVIIVAAVLLALVLVICHAFRGSHGLPIGPSSGPDMYSNENLLMLLPWLLLLTFFFFGFLFPEHMDDIGMSSWMFGLFAVLLVPSVLGQRSGRRNARIAAVACALIAMGSVAVLAVIGEGGFEQGCVIAMSMTVSVYLIERITAAPLDSVP